MINFSIVLPHITPFEFEGEANTGDSVQLNCYVSKGDTPLAISWTLNGKSIQPHSGISTIPIGDRTSLLTISSVGADHGGVFTCMASNRAGQSSHSATLPVNGAKTFHYFTCTVISYYYVLFYFHVPFQYPHKLCPLILAANP